jgi:hypothetical protein
MTRLTANTGASPHAGAATPPPTVQRLDAARRTAARIVRAHGPIYLPIFERLQAEYDARRTTETLIEELTTNT